MQPEQILKLPSMPAASPSYPMGPYRFINREFMIVTYETDHDLLRQAVPEPLEPNPDGQVLYDVVLHGAWTGPARLELIPSVNCPLADLPVRQIIGGLHMVTDMTLPYGKVIHDYLAK